MTITKDNYKSVDCVAYGDLIEFRDDLNYKVCSRWLSNAEGYNYKIFDILKVDKIEFCEKVYGYKPLNGGFPECVENDRDALTRVMKALFEALYPEMTTTSKSPKQSITCDIDINVKINI